MGNGLGWGKKSQYRENMEGTMEELHVCTYYRHIKTGEKYWLDGLASYADDKLVVYHRQGAFAGHLQVCSVEDFAREFEYIRPRQLAGGWR